MNARADRDVAQAASAPAALDEAILMRLEGHSSKKPARADDVIAAVGGDAAATRDALERLIADRRVVDAILMTPPAPSYQAVWPTYVTHKAGAWRNASHGGLFARHTTPLRLPAGPDPMRDPRPDLGYATAAQKAAHAGSTEKAKSSTNDGAKAPNDPPKPTAEANITMNRKKAEERRDTAAKMIQGRTLENAIALEKIAAALGLSQEGARFAVIELEKAGKACRVTIGRGTKRQAVVYDPRVDPAASTTLSDGNRVMRQRGALPDQIKQVINGVASSAAITTAQLVERIAPDGVEIYQSSVNKALAKLHSLGEIGEVKIPKEPGAFGPMHVTAWYDPQAGSQARAESGLVEDDSTTKIPARQCDPKEVAFASAHTSDEPLSTSLTSAEHFVELNPDNDPEDRFHFALFCSGQLGITVGSHYLLLPPSAVRRLCALIGVSQGGCAA